MKRKIISFICLICVLCTCTGMTQPGSAAGTGSEVVKASHVYMTYADEDKVDVLQSVAELETGVMASLHFDVELEKAQSGLTYKMFQYDGSANKRYEIISSSSPSFDVEIEAFNKDIPVYFSFLRGSEHLGTTLLTIRIRQGRAETIVPKQFESEFSQNLEVNMDELLPGMKFQMHPYILPITAKTFTDGRVVIGLGFNSNNVKFWNNVYKGTLTESANVKEFSDSFWGKSENKNAVKGRNLGLVIEFSGWIQGNYKKTEDMKGELSAYFGSGFAVSGQYGILTWDITLSIGAGGQLEFKLTYNEDKSQYDQFVVDTFSIFFKSSLEIYGGIGLSSIASAGVYGSGSITGLDQYYPSPVIRSIVLAGECGVKVKVFSRTLFSFAVVSGSKEFVEDKNSGKSNTLLNVNKLDSIDQYLLGTNGGYAGTVGAIDEPESEGTWFKGEKLKTADGLKWFDTDPDYDDIIATDVYPENRLQVLSTGTDDFPQISIFFLKTDTTRKNGNRSRLAHFYYNEQRSYLSEPVWIFDQDDKTADYNPYAFRSDYNGKTYLVWQNTLKEMDDTASFEEIAANSDLYFSEYYPSYPWTEPERVTFYADDKGAGLFAAGARTSETSGGDPIISYYTNSVDDPVGIDPSSSHDVCLAYKENGQWVQEKAFSVTGTISDLETAYFQGAQMIAVSYTADKGDGGKAYIMELRQKKGASWDVVFSRQGKDEKVVSAGRFVDAGRGSRYLTWYEDGGLYLVRNDSFEAEKLTSDDLKIPTSDYQLFGSFAKSNIGLIGKESKDSSENAFTIVSDDAGETWRKAVITDIDENATVNEIGLAFTREEEPIVFYSVQNYGVNPKLDMSYLAQDAEALLESPLRSKFKGLGSGFFLGSDDPRFTDTRTDLYMKARGANRNIEIKNVTFDDPDGTRRGEPTPMTVSVENTGLYRITNVTLYQGDQKLGDYPVNLKGGASAEIKTSVIVPEDAGNDPIDYLIKASTKTDQIDSEYTGTLDIGRLRIKYSHLLQRGNESVGYQIYSNGFLARKVYIYLFNEETGENFYQYAVNIPAKSTQEGQTSLVSGLFTQMGHEKIKAYILTEEESRKVPAGTKLDQFEEALELDPARSYHVDGLTEIYLQDVSGALNAAAGHELVTAPDPGVTADQEEEKAGHNTAILIIVLIGAVLAAAAAVRYLFFRRKGEEEDAEGDITDAEGSSSDAEGSSSDAEGSSSEDESDFRS